jgi:hypothetical protein
MFSGPFRADRWRCGCRVGDLGKSEQEGRSSFDSDCAQGTDKNKCGSFDSRAAHSPARFAQDDIQFLSLRMTGEIRREFARKKHAKHAQMAQKRAPNPCLSALLGNSLSTFARTWEILWLQTLIKWLISGYLSQKSVTT